MAASCEASSHGRALVHGWKGSQCDLGGVASPCPSQGPQPADRCARSRGRAVIFRKILWFATSVARLQAGEHADALCDVHVRQLLWCRHDDRRRKRHRLAPAIHTCMQAVGARAAWESLSNVRRGSTAISRLEYATVWHLHTRARGVQDREQLVTDCQMSKGHKLNFKVFRMPKGQSKHKKIANNVKWKIVSMKMTG